MLEYSLCAFENRKIIIKEGELLAFMLPSVQIPNSLYLLLPLGLREGNFEAKKTRYGKSWKSQIRNNRRSVEENLI